MITHLRLRCRSFPHFEKGGRFELKQCSGLARDFIKNIFFILCFAFFLTPLCASHPYHQHDLPKNLKIEETGDTLTLRGVALHKHYFQDRYYAAFYSHNPLTNPKQALDDNGAKRMWIYFVQPMNYFREGVLNALKDNNSPQLMDRNQINISQFLKMIDVPMKHGDIIVFDYLPKVGTKIMINGSVRGIIKGNEFYTYVLRIWMGRQPPSKKFRQDLFNLSS